MLFLQVTRDFRELGEAGLEIFDDIGGGDDFGVGKVGAVFEAFIFEAEPSRWRAASQTGRPRG